MKYYGSLHGQHRGRSRPETCAMPDFGWIRGWDAGVRVEPDHSSRSDRLKIYMDGGSHEAGGKTLLGEVRATEAGPRWVPAGPAVVAPVTVKAGGRALPVIASVPVGSHRNEDAPAGYVCVVLAGRYASGEPWFGIAQLTREDDGWTVNSHSDFWDDHMSQTAAVTAMVELTGHSRPACTKPHAVPGKAASTDAGSSRGTDADVLSEISDALQDACADPEDTLARIERALSRES
jgi:hypothetical protein